MGENHCGSIRKIPYTESKIKIECVPCGCQSTVPQIRITFNISKHPHDIVDTKKDTANAIGLRRKEARRSSYTAASQSGVSNRMVSEISVEVNNVRLIDQKKTFRHAVMVEGL